MVDSSSEVALRRLERVVRGEVDVQEEHTSSIRRVIRTHDGCLPVILVFLVDGASRAVSGGIFTQVNKFLLDSFEGHLSYFKFLEIKLLYVLESFLLIYQYLRLTIC